MQSSDTLVILAMRKENGEAERSNAVATQKGGDQIVVQNPLFFTKVVIHRLGALPVSPWAFFPVFFSVPGPV